MPLTACCFSAPSLLLSLLIPRHLPVGPGFAGVDIVGDGGDLGRLSGSWDVKGQGLLSVVDLSKASGPLKSSLWPSYSIF
jgi:hypothetical protein